MRRPAARRPGRWPSTPASGGIAPRSWLDRVAERVAGARALTVEPDGRGYGSADFGSYQSGEFQFREENGKASVTLPHPVGRQGTKTFPARFAGDDTIELLDDGGKMIYALKRQPPRPAAKLAELAGNWEGWDVAADGAAGAAGGHDLVLGLHRLAVTLDAAGRGKWQRTDGGTGEIALQERDGRFQFDGLEGKTWQGAPVRIGRDSTVLRFRTPDGTVRVYLRKLTTKGDAAGPAGGTGKAP